MILKEQWNFCAFLNMILHGSNVVCESLCFMEECERTSSGQKWHATTVLAEEPNLVELS